MQYDKYNLMIRVIKILQKGSYYTVNLRYHYVFLIFLFKKWKLIGGNK